MNGHKRSLKISPKNGPDYRFSPARQSGKALLLGLLECYPLPSGSRVQS